MREYEIKRCIDNYYAIQDLRKDTFNRIVCWVRDNKERIKEALGSRPSANLN